MPPRIFLPKGAFKRLFVVGLGQVVPHVAALARKAKADVTVLTSKRQIGARDPFGHLLADLIVQAGGQIEEAENLTPLMARDPAGAIVLSFGSPWIFRADFLAHFGGRVINSHAAPLPEWRGGGGFSWRILADDRRGASCFHLVTPGIDDGDIVLYRPYQFPKSLRLPREWEDHAIKHEKAALTQLIDGFAKGRGFVLRRQQESRSTYVPRLYTPTHAWIDWRWTATDIERFVLAFSHGYPGARTCIGDEEARIFDVRKVKAARTHPFMNGLVIRATVDDVHVQVTDGRLAIRRSDIEGVTRLREGDRFWTPAAMLDRAYATRVSYGPEGLRLPKASPAS